MSHAEPYTFETILRLIAQASPNPWYPRDYAQVTDTPRERLEPLLEGLRLSGLLRLTDWTAEHGQGYTLTPEGARTVESPGVMSRLAVGQLPRPAAPKIFAPEVTRRTAWDRGEAIREALLGSFRPTVTYILLAVNILVFAAGIVLANRLNIPLNNILYGSHQRILHDTGAVLATDILQGQWWRLLTSCFVHIGLMHLGMNMYGLVVLGSVVERLFGHWRFLLIYLVAGLGGSCVGVFFQFNIAGASGALCGLITAFAAWLFLNRAFLPPPLVAAWQRNILINCMLIVFVSLIPGISWSGHLGGAVVGLLAGALMNVEQFGKLWQRGLAWLGIVILPLGCFGLLALAPRYHETWGEMEIDYDLIPATRGVDTEALSAYSQADTLLRQNATRRSPDKVEQVLAELEKARADVHQAAERYRRAGPYLGLAEQARRARLEHLEAWDLLCQLTDKCLREGEQCTPQEAQAIHEQEQRAIDLSRRWRSFLK